MKNEKEFYVGYFAKAPKGIYSFLKKRLLILGLLVILIAISFSMGQKQFVNSTFELGQLTEIEGTYYENPYPILQVESGNSSKSVLLLGFRKFGADQSIEEIKSQNHSDLIGRQLKVKGTLVYYNGKSLFQLENNLEGTYEVSNNNSEFKISVLPLGNVSLKGEIIDPKCYFGVMKPGEGKIHRSCAVRCLSGGIPPVFVTTNQNGENNYYLLTNEKGERIRKVLLPFVGKPVAIEGKLVNQEDWMSIRLDTNKIELLDNYSSLYSH